MPSALDTPSPTDQVKIIDSDPSWYDRGVREAGSHRDSRELPQQRRRQGIPLPVAIESTATTA